MTINAHLPSSWWTALAGEFDQPYMQTLMQFLDAEKKAGKQIYPPLNELFRALELVPLGRVKVVILGQDPYHGEGQAHGLSFSVRSGVRTPPSLKNIYKELHSDLNIQIAKHGFLEHWASQGVLLLNSVLTVEMGRAASHQKKGWEQFTDRIIRLVNEQQEPVVFLLWGAHAQKKAVLVDQDRHLVLKAAHPSPLSAHTGFLGCRHFSQTNAFLVCNHRAAIDWALPPI